MVIHPANKSANWFVEKRSLIKDRGRLIKVLNKCEER